MDPVVIERALKQLEELPAKVAEWRVEVGEDASGDAAIWVWATLSDFKVETATRQAIRERVRKAAQEAAAFWPEPWVYVRVLARSEEPTR
jgi:hypothetical protein